MASKYCVYFLPVLAILLAGDVEVNPDPLYAGIGSAVCSIVIFVGSIPT